MILPLADIKAYLGIPALDTTQDAFLTTWGGIVTDAIEVFCRRKLVASNIVETMYADDVMPTNAVHLYEYPVNSVTSVELDGNAITDYRIENKSGRLFASCGFFNRNYELKVTYNAGYSALTMPPTIKYAFLSIIEEKYNKKKAGIDINFGSDVQRISIPGTIGIDFDYTLTNNEANNEMGNILGNYLNVLSYYRSERSITPDGKVTYVN